MTPSATATRPAALGTAIGTAFGAPAPRTPAPGRRAQHRADARPQVAMPTRRTPLSVELADVGSPALLGAVLDGLRAVPEREVLDRRTRLRAAARARWERVDLASVLLVTRAGIAASALLTALLVLWLAHAGRLA